MSFLVRHELVLKISELNVINYHLANGVWKHEHLVLEKVCVQWHKHVIKPGAFEGDLHCRRHLDSSSRLELDGL